MDKEKEFERICQKLGFIPRECKIEYTDTEDDNWENPFLKLTDEENDFLWKNGYLSQ